MKHLTAVTTPSKAEHPGVSDAISAFLKDPVGTIGLHVKAVTE